MFRSSRTSLFAVMTVVMLLLLAACGDDDEPIAAGGGTVAETEPGDQSSDDAESDTTTTSTEPESTTTTTEPEPEPTGGEACLVGTWLVDNDHWGEMFEAFARAEGGEGFQVIGVTGVGSTEFRADGTTETIYDEWTITATVASAPGEMSIIRTGVDQGTWTAEGDHLTMVDTDVTSVVRTTMGGMELPTGGGGSTYDASLLEGSATYECSGDRLSVTMEGATAVLNRVG